MQEQISGAAQLVDIDSSTIEHIELEHKKCDPTDAQQESAVGSLAHQIDSDNVTLSPSSDLGYRKSLQASQDIQKQVRKILPTLGPPPHPLPIQL